MAWRLARHHAERFSLPETPSAASGAVYLWLRDQRCGPRKPQRYDRAGTARTGSLESARVRHGAHGGRSPSTITAKGETTFATKGFTGATCRDTSRFIEQALRQRIGEQRTAESYQAATIEQTQQQGA